MTKQEFRRATNHINMKMTLTLMTQIWIGDHYGIPIDEYDDIVSRLEKAERKLANSYELEDGA